MSPAAMYSLQACTRSANSSSVKLASAGAIVTVAVARYRPAQLLDDLRPQRLALGFRPVVQQRNAARQMIEYEQRCRRNERRVGHARLLARVLRQLLEEAHDIVPGHADEAAGERQPRRRARAAAPAQAQHARRRGIPAGLRPGARLAVNQQRLSSMRTSSASPKPRKE